MKTLGFLLASALILMAGSVASAQAPVHHASGEVINSQEVKSVFLENDSLVVRESRETMRVEGVPQGISADTALKLVNGSLPKAEIVSGPDPAKNTCLFSFHLFRVEREYVASTIKYKGGWLVDHRVFKTVEDDVILTFFGLWMPAFLIGLLSIRNALAGVDHNRLVVFYGLLVAISLIGGLTSIPTGLATGTILGTVAGVVACGKCVHPDSPFPVGFFPGIFVGTLTGTFSGLVAMSTRPKDPMLYLAFILGTSLSIYVITLLVDKAKRKLAELDRAN